MDGASEPLVPLSGPTSLDWFMADESRYILSKKIARGGMAEIYLGKHIGEDGFQRLCAIKRILPHYAQDQEFIQMFRDEAHICKRLQHANIVRVEGFEEVEGSFAIIMEFVDGPDLRTLLHALEQTSSRLPIPYACHIIGEAARGLHFAHTKEDEITQQPLGIVHRDISPQNILVSYEGEVKVTDFGIADAESKITETRPGIVKGKYSYMSPEQISAKTVDARTDVFALAIVLWEMLAMRRLFQGENEVDTIQRVKNCKIDAELIELNQNVSPELDAIVKKGLAKDPKKRYRNAADFEKDLRRFMSRQYPDFTPEDLGGFLKKLMEQRRHEAAADIKRTLTETNLRPGKRGSSGSLEKARTQGVDLSIDDASQRSPALSLSRGPTATTAKTKSNVAGSPASAFPAHQKTSSHDKNRSLASSQALSILLPGLRRRQKRKVKLWGFAAVAAVSLMIGVRFAAGLFAQAQPGVIILRTQPPRVKIKLDGIDLKQGSYLTASSKRPLRIPVKAGEHTITMGRAGYNPMTWSFRIEEGGRIVKDDIVLKEKGEFAAVRVRSKTNDKPIQFDVNNGYFVGVLLPGKIQAQAVEFLAGKPYLMKVTSSGISFSCSVTAHALSWRQPNDVVIDTARRRCTVVGP